MSVGVSGAFVVFVCLVICLMMRVVSLFVGLYVT